MIRFDHQIKLSPLLPPCGSAAEGHKDDDEVAGGVGENDEEVKMRRVDAFGGGEEKERRS